MLFSTRIMFSSLQKHHKHLHITKSSELIRRKSFHYAYPRFRRHRFARSQPHYVSR